MVPLTIVMQIDFALIRGFQVPMELTGVSVNSYFKI